MNTISSGNIIMPASKKLVAVLNATVDISNLLVALAHMAVGLGASIENKEELRLADYEDADGNSHPNISELPFIILKAKNSSQLRKLRQLLLENSVRHVDFSNNIMYIGTSQAHELSRKSKEADLEYYGIVIFDDWEVVTDLTKRFSLWK